MKVYLVKEYWNNCDDYGDYRDGEYIICATIDEELAKREIQKVKNELLEKIFTFEKSNKDISCSFEWDGDMDGITVKAYTYGGISGRSSGSDYYRWAIEEYDLIEF